MNVNDEIHYTLDELSSLTGVSKRTIRFYMQSGLVPKPAGANRGAYYHEAHLNRLLEIQKWQKAGISLKRIAELLCVRDEPQVPEREIRPGDITVKSHILLHPGVELVVDPVLSGLTAEEVTELTRHVLQFFYQRNNIHNNNSNSSVHNNGGLNESE